MNNHKPNCIYLLVFILVLGLTVQNASAELHSVIEGASSSSYIPLISDPPVQFNVTDDRATVALNICIDEISRQDSPNGVAWRIDNEGSTDEPGMPQLPAIGRWVRVPDRGKLELDYHLPGQRRVKGGRPVLVEQRQGEDNADQSLEALAIQPPEPVVMGRPMVMRGVRMVPLTVFPVRWDADAGEYLVSESVDVEIRVVGGRGVNEVVDRERIPSRGFDRMIDALLVNPPRRDDPRQYPPGGYLLVADENPPQGVAEFYDWKHQSGHPVQILTFNPDETDTDGLRDLIRGVYDDFNFEYLVFFGNEDAQPPLQIPYHMGGGDWFYDIYFAQLEGDDMLPDVAVGTFNCMSGGNLLCAVRRAISYQSEPYMEETDWFTRAGVGVGACSVPQDLSPSYTGKWVAEVLGRNGFDDITASFYSDNEVDDPTPMVRDLYNSRTNFILVRAHQSRFDADEIEETGVYPFHFLVSSATLQGAWRRAFRMGEPNDMRGPSAGFGHYSSPRTNIANALAGGLIEGMFFLDLGCYGWARNYAVANLARVMPDDGIELMPYYYSHWQYWGDPGQWCWRGVPRRIQAEFSETLDPDATEFTVHVTTDEDDPQPVPGAIVCLSQQDHFQADSRTDEIGFSVFTFERGDLDEGDLNITITGENLYPVKAVIQVIQADVFVALDDVEYDDEADGNGDGIPNPDEAGNLFFELRNACDRQTPAAAVLLEGLSPWVVVEPVDRRMVPLDPGDAVRLEDPFPVTILPGCPDGETVELRLSITFDEELPIVMSGVRLEVEAPALAVGSALPEDEFEPGSETELRVSIINVGRCDAGELTARLVSLSPFVQVIANNCRYPEIPVDEEVEPQGDALMISAAEVTVPGSIAEFMIILEGDPGVLDTLYFSLPVGEAGEGDPLGPDSYGYIALDDGDDDVEWADAPDYDWLDISPWGGGDVEGELLGGLPVNGESDASVLVDLPVEFRYCGEDFNQVTVCSNGWIAMGDQTELVNQQNWVMPGFDGAYGMIAVFWDRLHMQTRSDGVFTYYDQDNDRFYIEWHTGVLLDNNWAPNVFELVLYDCNEYQTPTGDSPILMQYNTVNNVQGEWEANYHCSVGISSPDGKDGLLYTYWNDYPPQCAPLQDGRAILWTTIQYDIDVGTIRGQVNRYIDSTAVSGATVRTSNGFETLTNDVGEYEMLGVEPGIFNITVNAEGYSEVVQEGVELEADDELELDFVLPHGWLEVNADTLFLEIGLNREEFNLTLSNMGNAGLSFRITSDCPFLIFEPTEGHLETGEDADVISTIDDQYEFEPGHYEYELIIENDTPVNPVVIPIIVDILSVVDYKPELPGDYIIFAPYPNPFNSSTTVRFGVPVDADVELSLFDLSGRRVTSVESGSFQAGWHRSVIDASGLATGLYFIRMDAGDFSSMQRVLLVR